MGETQLSGIIVYNLISNFLASRSHCQPTFLLSFVCLLLVEQRLISLLSAVVTKLNGGFCSNKLIIIRLKRVSFLVNLWTKVVPFRFGKHQQFA